MNSLPRFLGYSLVLLAFIAAGFGVQAWLKRQSDRIRAETIEDKRAQFSAALAALPKPADFRDEGRLRNLERTIGAKITLYGDQVRIPAEPPNLQTMEFVASLDSNATGSAARVVFPMPAAIRLVLINQRVVLVIALVVPALLALLVGAFLFGSARHAGTRGPWPVSARAEMGSLEHLAKASVARGEELDRERDVRRRAEEDAELRQQLLASALEEKIRLGRDLHDGIIQSLYAAGLTLESARAVAAADPAEADRRMSQCLEGLNRTIRDVRSYITGLAPENLRRAGFSQALASLIAELRANRKVDFELRIDSDATALLTDQQSSNALQIAREAISNSLRHGAASRVTVRLHQTDREVCLLIQDNGSGFDTSRRSSGNGLGNMRARAENLGATLRTESQPGSGTRVVVTMPLVGSSP